MRLRKSSFLFFILTLGALVLPRVPCASDDVGTPLVRVRNETGVRWLPLDENGARRDADVIESGGAISLAPLATRRYVTDSGDVKISFAPSSKDPTVAVIEIEDPRRTPALLRHQIDLALHSPNVITLGREYALMVRPVVPTAFDLPATEIPAGETMTGYVVMSDPGAEVVVTLRAEPDGLVSLPSEVTAEQGRAKFDLRATRPTRDTPIVLRATAGATERNVEILVRRQPWRVVAVTTVRHRATGGAKVIGTVHVAGMTEDTDPITLSLESDSPLAKVPADVEVRWAPRVSRADFEIQTESVGVATSVRITARGESGERGWNLRLEPLIPADVALTPPQPGGGGKTTATLILSDVAPADALFHLEAGPAGTLTVPAEVRVTKGQRSVSFPLGGAPGTSLPTWLSAAPTAFPGLVLRKTLTHPAPPRPEDGKKRGIAE